VPRGRGQRHHRCVFGAPRRGKALAELVALVALLARSRKLLFARWLSALVCAPENQALRAVHYLIDELKASVPIWKLEVYEVGTAQHATACAALLTALCTATRLPPRAMTVCGRRTWKHAQTSALWCPLQGGHKRKREPAPPANLPLSVPRRRESGIADCSLLSHIRKTHVAGCARLRSGSSVTSFNLTAEVRVVPKGGVEVLNKGFISYEQSEELVVRRPPVRTVVLYGRLRCTQQHSEDGLKHNG
jgi:hypothetical protein